MKKSGWISLTTKTSAGGRHGEGDDREGKIGDEPQGDDGERRDGVHREGEHLPEGILRLAREARLAVVLHGNLPAPDPADHPADEAVAFAHAAQRLGHAAVHQAEITRVGRNLALGHPLEQSVEKFCGEKLEGGLARPGAALTVGDVGAVFPGGHHFDDDLGRVLQVGIDEHDHIALRHIQAGGDGGLVPKLRSRLTTRTAGSRAASSSAAARVRSRLPSFTSTISWAQPSCAQTAFTRRTNSGRPVSSL